MKGSGSVSFLSPVISAARREVNNMGYADHQTDMMGDRHNSLSVNGHKFMASSQIDSPTNKLGGGKYHSFRRQGRKSQIPKLDVSINDMVQSVTNTKKAFGFEGYITPSNKPLLMNPFNPIKAPKLTIPRVKKDSYITEIIKKKSFIIQGPDHYSKIEKWENLSPPRSGMFKKSERYTIAGEI